MCCGMYQPILVSLGRAVPNELPWIVTDGDGPHETQRGSAVEALCAALPELGKAESHDGDMVIDVLPSMRGRTLGTGTSNPCLSGLVIEIVMKANTREAWRWQSLVIERIA